MNKIQKILGLLAITLAVFIDAQIHTIEHMRDIISLITGKNGELCIFDIDGTLIKALKKEASNEWVRQKYGELLANGMSLDDARATVMSLFMQAQSTSPVAYVDPDAGLLIKELAHKKIPTIVLTARSGSTEWVAITSRQFADMKIDFTQTGNLRQDLAMPELRGIALYHAGVIFADDNDKGAALELFCTKTGCMPTHIIFVDDMRDNVVAVEKFAQKYAIAFDGVHFSGS